MGIGNGYQQQYSHNDGMWTDTTQSEQQSHGVHQHSWGSRNDHQYHSQFPSGIPLGMPPPTNNFAFVEHSKFGNGGRDRHHHGMMQHHQGFEFEDAGWHGSSSAHHRPHHAYASASSSSSPKLHFSNSDKFNSSRYNHSEEVSDQYEYDHHGGGRYAFSPYHNNINCKPQHGFRPLWCRF